MDTVLRTAIDRLDGLKSQISKKKNELMDLQGEIGRLEGAAAELERWVDTYHEIAGIKREPTAYADIRPPRRKPRNPDRQLVVDQALEIILENGAPMSRKELFEALAARGTRIYGKDPEMVLSTMLWRTPEKIVRLPSHGYWPKDVEYEGANYFPIFGIAEVATEPEGGAEADDAD